MELGGVYSIVVDDNGEFIEAGRTCTVDFVWVRKFVETFGNQRVLV